MALRPGVRRVVYMQADVLVAFKLDPLIRHLPALGRRGAPGAGARRDGEPRGATVSRRAFIAGGERGAPSRVFFAAGRSSDLARDGRPRRSIGAGRQVACAP